MTKIFSIILALTFVVVIFGGPIENENAGADGDLATADSIGYGYYAAPAPLYYGGYGGGYGGGYKYGGYRSYGRYYGGYYRPRIYPVWG